MPCELAEEAVLARFGPLTDGAVTATAHPVLAGLSEADRRAVVARRGPVLPGRCAPRPCRRRFERRLFVLAGRLSVTIHVDGRGRGGCRPSRPGWSSVRPPCWAPAGGAPTSDGRARHLPRAVNRGIRRAGERTAGGRGRDPAQPPRNCNRDDGPPHPGDGHPRRVAAARFSPSGARSPAPATARSAAAGPRGSRGRSRPGSACGAGSCPRR